MFTIICNFFVICFLFDKKCKFKLIPYLPAASSHTEKLELTKEKMPNIEIVFF